jgi:23S rRNA (guanosine2251-2'-O)-methyltransferase
MRQIVLIAHDIRSCHNVGSLLRTAEGLGVTKIYLTGYTPHPSKPNDDRLPHIGTKLTKDIHKTALGAEDLVDWEYCADPMKVVQQLKGEGFVMCALEQTPTSTPLPEFVCPDRAALILGREVEGVDPILLAQCDITLEIPMFGKKESFNVVQAAAMTLYQMTFH